MMVSGIPSLRKDMAEVNKFGTMEPFMTAVGKMIRLMEKGVLCR